jgi:hypothetical protein
MPTEKSVFTAFKKGALITSMYARGHRCTVLLSMVEAISFSIKEINEEIAGNVGNFIGKKYLTEK